MRRHKTWVPPSKLPLPDDTVYCDTCGQEIPWDGSHSDEPHDCEDCIRVRWERAIDFDK